MQTFTLKLNSQEVDVIFAGLGNLPFVQAETTVVNLRAQIQKQLESTNKPAPVAKTPKTPRKKGGK